MNNAALRRHMESRLQPETRRGALASSAAALHDLDDRQERVKACSGAENSIMGNSNVRSLH